jgi:carbamate kinase
MHPGGIKGTVKEQRDLAARAGQALLPIMQMDNELIITHGNGPVVGKILMRQAIARHRVAPMTLDICVAHSQGGIAYLLTQALENTLRLADNPRAVVCLLTQVEVDPHDPAFDHPSKPVGYFFSQSESQEIVETLGWEMSEDAGRGWRHVVPSPQPRNIVDISLIATVARSGAVVVAGGGGGIPVIRNANGTRSGVEAVIDKDLCSAHMANALDVDIMLILTAVERVAIHFGEPKQQALTELSADELEGHQAAGHFAAGSMGPKVEAAIKFIRGGGQRAIIAHLYDAERALRGEAGTQIIAGHRSPC